MTPVIDLTGQRFGGWTVIARAPNSRRGQAMWRCACSCGSTGIVKGAALRRGHSRSCVGCARAGRRRVKLPDAKRQAELVAERAADPPVDAVRRAECQAVELRAERGDAERRLGELHERRAALVAGVDDGRVAEALAGVDSQIRAAEARLRVVHVWGVDPAVDRLAFAFARVDSSAIEVETVRTDSSATEGERLGWLDRQVRIFARQRAGEFPAACVWVEQPSGKFRNLTLAYAVGVIQAALFEVLGCPVWTIPSSAWKQRTVGVGNASKEQVAAWVLEQGASVNGQDECDAYAIAAAGRAMFTSGEWSASA